MRDAQYDVVIVGASLAGCTAASLLGRRGLRVALLEKHPRPDAFKRVCTHYIQASATPTIERLGLTPQLEAAGAIKNSIEGWTPWGWVRAGVGKGVPAHGYSIRREKLDPMLRRVAAETPGVELLLGHTATELLRDAERFSGVVVESAGR